MFKKQRGTLKYSEEQVAWLHMIKDYIAASFHVDKQDFALDPFNKKAAWASYGSCLEQKQIVLLMN